jgi:hypothetical protein
MSPMPSNVAIRQPDHPRLPKIPYALGIHYKQSSQKQQRFGKKNWRRFLFFNEPTRT